MRLVRRVSGILLQLTVFELPQAVAEAALIGYIPSNPAHLGIDVSIPELAAAVSRGENEVGFAEVRTILSNLKRHTPPAFRVVGYDPRSKRKVILSVQPQAILEVAGGVFSPYLNPDKRKDLAKVVCDALMLYFPANKPYELTIPWSGAKNITSNAEVGRDKKVSNRSSAERVMQRKGRIFRSGMRISKYDLVLSVFQDDSDAAMLSTQGMRLIFNFYSPSVSEAAEVVVDEAQQLERMGKLITSNPEGSIRAAAVRRFCRFFRAEIIEDILDPTHRTLHVVLLPPDKGFVSEYQYIRVPPPGENIRPVGLPTVFAPLDTCGVAIHRRGMTLFNRDRDTQPQQKEFLVTVYTKSPIENPERGLVIKLYDRATSQTSVLHLGPSELMRICSHADEPDLMADMVTAQVMQDQSIADVIEEGFKEFTKKGELESKTKSLVDIYVDVVLRDLGFYMSPLDTVVPYVLSAPKGIFPQ
ncbi:hypothetical protein EON65_22480 [archaeon]|nr:MAG: hypothetical protein EON65_22480 [archaeon]